LPAALALGTVLIYVFVYTPLKPRSSLNTVVGAVTGAVPPLIGWSAASGQLDLGAWLLGALLFLWQVPHFFALAWLYRKDYARGGFRMLPVIDPTGHLTFRVLVVFAALLLPLGLVLVLAGVAGPWFALGSLTLGVGWVAVSVRLLRSGSDRDARRAFLASLVYLPLALVLMVADTHTLVPANSERFVPIGAAYAAADGESVPSLTENLSCDDRAAESSARDDDEALP
jgi:protoheme IX farnesyltransferase